MLLILLVRCGSGGDCKSFVTAQDGAPRTECTTLDYSTASSIEAPVTFRTRVTVLEFNRQEEFCHRQHKKTTEAKHVSILLVRRHPRVLKTLKTWRSTVNVTQTLNTREPHPNKRIKINIHADVNYTAHQIHVPFVSSVLLLESEPVDLKGCRL